MNKLNVVFRLLFAVTLIAASTLSQAQVISAPVPVLSLKAGWNLVGNSSNKAFDIPAVFASKSSEVQSIWHWNTATSSWEFYSPALTATELASYAASRGYGVLATVKVGEGYWVNAKGIAEITLPYDSLNLPLCSPLLPVSTSTCKVGGNQDTDSKNVRETLHNSPVFPRLRIW